MASLGVMFVYLSKIYVHGYYFEAILLMWNIPYHLLTLTKEKIMHYPFIEYHQYKAMFLDQFDSNLYFPLAPANWRELNHVSRIVNANLSLKGDEIFRNNGKFRDTVLALEKVFNFERSREVYRMVKIGDICYIDPTFTGIEDNLVYGKGCYIPKSGIRTETRKTLEKYIELLGGNTLSGNWQYTKILINPHKPKTRGCFAFYTKLPLLVHEDILSAESLKTLVLKTYQIEEI